MSTHKTMNEIATMVQALSMSEGVTVTFSPNGGEIYVESDIVRGRNGAACLALVKTAKKTLVDALLAFEVGRTMTHRRRNGFAFWRMYLGETGNHFAGWRAGVSIEIDEDTRKGILIGGGSVARVWGL